MQRDLTLAEMKSAAMSKVGPLPIVIFTKDAGDNGPPTGKLVEIRTDGERFFADFGDDSYSAPTEEGLRRKLRSLGVATSDDMRMIAPEPTPTWGNGVPVESRP